MNNQNRNLFEKEFNEILKTEMSLTGKPGRDIAFERHPDHPDEYVQLRTVRAYRVWQAATKRNEQEISELVSSGDYGRVLSECNRDTINDRNITVAQLRLEIESLQSEIQPFRVGKTGRKDITGDMINIGDEIWIIHNDADGENKLGVVQYMPNECCFVMVDGNNWEWFADYTNDDSYGGLVKVENIGKYIQANR